MAHFLRKKYFFILRILSFLDPWNNVANFSQYFPPFSLLQIAIFSRDFKSTDQWNIFECLRMTWGAFEATAWMLKFGAKENWKNWLSFKGEIDWSLTKVGKG